MHFEPLNNPGLGIYNPNSSTAMKTLTKAIHSGTPKGKKTAKQGRASTFYLFLLQILYAVKFSTLSCTSQLLLKSMWALGLRKIWTWSINYLYNKRVHSNCLTKRCNQTKTLLPHYIQHSWNKEANATTLLLNQLQL